MPHSFPLTLRWSGDTAAPNYEKNAEAVAPGKPPILVSSGGAYGGEAARWNPEDLLGASLATCHLLTFLALAAKAKVAVHGYEDQVEVVLDTVSKVTSVTEVRLHPRITVAAGADTDKARELCEKAHRYCFISNSLKSRVLVEPTVVAEPVPGAGAA